ncbi:MAG: YlxM family DNA-binding protein [Bacillota bacterium]|nr:YlxM family DNA-binding protein [Bacillota bacterium]
MLEKRPLINLLYDFYGPLLTDRQRTLMELYYEQDLSLGEIADQCGITRQGVHDGLKRAGEALERYEEKLGLVNRHLAQRERLERLRAELERMTGPETERIRNMLRELLGYEG